MQHIKLHVDHTYRTLYPRRIRRQGEPLPSLAAIVSRIAPVQLPYSTDVPQPLPSTAQQINYAQHGHALLDNVPFQPDYNTVWAWNLFDPIVIFGVFAFTLLVGFFNMLRFAPAEFDRPGELEDLFGHMWEEEGEEDAGDADEVLIPQALEEVLEAPGYETDRDDD
ncbi:hypothetical protein B0J12DRAFT_789659 [Macrophomina phaseolina]|uniref:Transmembrane protein n=1 Tax=Macrophomina phaseolina TaxID=35725 RepID=A0ABQ8FVL0_9PEZI|nr:hypothetical protein B0J12DRAFT_789659 [Macrophomina phaseolina]